MNYIRDISAFRGCTAGPAAALENLRTIEHENLAGNAAPMASYLLERRLELQKRHPIIGDVRGKGSWRVLS
jgi:taurine-pyruvate aminotransferase